MLKTRFCLIRHGETAWNAERRLQGHTDISLNDQGKIQAAQMAQALKKSNLQFDVLYTSTLKRAIETANAIEQCFARPAIQIDALRERHFGALQGLTTDEAPTLQPPIWQAHINRQLDHDLDGGESILQFSERIEGVFEQLRQKHLQKTILIVSHGGVLDMMFRIISKQALSAQRQASVPNAALNWIAHDGERWEIERWADTSHLDNIALDNIDL